MDAPVPQMDALDESMAVDSEPENELDELAPDNVEAPAGQSKKNQMAPPSVNDYTEETAPKSRTLGSSLLPTNRIESMIAADGQSRVAPRN